MQCGALRHWPAGPACSTEAAVQLPACLWGRYRCKAARSVAPPPRSSYQTDRERELARNVPAAPPSFTPPPPPPPPPPPEPVVENELSGISRRSLFAFMAGGVSLYWLALRGGFPLAAVDRKRNVALLKTKGGNLVAATEDSAGRVFMFDKAGNIYYDTEDARTGMYIVDTEGRMYNKFVDKQGQVQTVEVGNIADLETISATEIGGVPVSEMQKSIKQLRGGRITGFRTYADPQNLEDYMPPNAAYTRRADGTLDPPAFLEDLTVDLELKKQVREMPDVSPADVLESLQYGDK
ncbi:hypothetical protein D9Q98_006517 [Chlorella vulgaris]|uniref:Uncharacterized protein n=1 Tax=Chlorella vulgaris TaxID=3077 RepID=A0A9D4TKH9_CHLVU|nr:hypothetical protein D9Q98_006517 [Chlorella vulgaris]